MLRPLATTLLLLPALLLPQVAAQVEGTITERGFDPHKIAVPGALDPRATAEESSELIQTIRDDLEFSTYFEIADPELYARVPPPASDGTEQWGEWESVGADWLLRVWLVVDNGEVDLRAKVFSTRDGRLRFSRRYAGPVNILRRVAHNVADDIIDTFVGEGAGISMSRMAFVSKHGEGKEVYLMDYDGRNIRRLTTTNTINLSPVWSPDGNELAFVSWRGDQPGVYVMDTEGNRGFLPTVGGELAIAPEWSPDGNRLAYSSDVAGNTELYMLDRRTSRNTRLTINEGIDTAPAFSPNGRQVAFTSDRAGSPQIYLMDAEGNNQRRLSYGTSYADSAAFSPDGERLVYVSRIDGRFQLILHNLERDSTLRITRDNANHENPRWSPDGRHLVFSSDRTGKYQIYTMRYDGSNQRQLTRGPASFTPDWSR